jgi:PiT family inorganic phosphate transporter
MLMNLVMQLRFLGGVYLGWGVGANDTANIFGPAVATGAIRYRTAIILAAAFVLLGAVTEGPGLMEKVAELAGKDFTVSARYSSINLAFAASVAAAITITILTVLSIPSSTSQASVGSIMGIGIVLSGFAGAEWTGFLKMLVIWVSNPIITAIVAFLLFKILAGPVNYLIKSDIWYSRIFGFLLVVSGSYGAYALGASHAAVTTAPFYKSGIFGSGYKAALWASLVGGIGMSIGTLTYSRKVMETVGKKITVLDPFSAFISVLGSAITVHMCKQIGVPVSTSQAIVGAVMGVGFVKGAETVNFRSLRFIFLGWVMTPLVGALLSFAIIKVFL